MPKIFRSSKVWLWLVIIWGLNCMDAKAATWTPVGPEGGNIAVLAVDPQNPSVIYAGTNEGSGLFKSADGGAHWVVASTGLTNTAVISLAINQQKTSILYAGTYGGGLFKSNDGGAHWNASGLTGNKVNTIVIDPTLPTTMCVGIEKGGVFKSIDGGNIWTPTSLANANVSSLCADPQTPATLYAGTGDNTLHKSIDRGTTWQQIYAFNPTAGGVGAIAIDPQTPATLYVGLHSRGDLIPGKLYKSVDGGQTWIERVTGLAGRVDIHALAIDPQNPAILYAGTWAC
ncbi:MAG: hypothetical protein NTY36_03970 [Deltaproteobacteria bacterium]|nr:hypothetical protein [Deltaproteobacteria bacterium]